MSEITSRLSTALGDRYRIERRLGEGGMATVYLAEDIKHDRKVALKVLKAELAAVLGAERFIQEIKTTASLQHPHILPLFDSGEADAFLYYVMPYIEGETLRDKLDRETQLTIDEAVRIASDVADALDYAHRHNVIHRDIKPENILLHDGRPMVADFGIALAVSAAAGGRMTETGLSLGTPHYMSPEQATAEKDITARSDIYSLASVLYEMLTGDPPHTASSAQQIIMKIVTEEAQPVTALRKSVPPHVAAATAQALEKLPADRFASAAKFAEALGNEAFTTSAVADGTPAAAASGQGWPLRLGATAAAGVLVGVLLRSIIGPSGDASASATYTRILLSATGNEATPGFVASAALAPDGSAIVYGDSADDAGWQLWIKEDSEPYPTRLGQQTGRDVPFAKTAFSPDGETIAFIDDDRLKRVGRRGGAVTTLSDSTLYNVAWLDNASIVATNFQGEHAYRIPTGGGPTEVLFESPGVTFISHFSPLPSGDALLFTARSQDLLSITLYVFVVASGEVRELLDGPNAAWYVSSGHIVYTTLSSDVFAVPFDADRLEIVGDPTPMLERVRNSSTATSTEYPDLQIAPNGTLLYVPQGAADQLGGTSRFMWIDTLGVSTEVDTSWQMASISNGGLSVSPDGRRIAYDALIESGRIDIYVKPLPDGAASRLTFDGTQNVRPQWNPSGDSLLFVSNRQGQQDLWVQRADGSGGARVLVDRERPVWEGLWSPDREWVVYRTGDEAAGRGDILAFRPGRDTADVELVATEHEETSPDLSPDGRWLAYTSDVSGRKEVYVRPFPNVDEGLWQVSNGGGTEPLWAENGRSLVFRAGARVMVAAVTTDPTFSVGAPRTLFSTRALGNNDSHFYDVAPDGSRFVFVVPLIPRLTSVDLVLVRNYLGVLEAAFRR